jgi:hypothetical protein
MSDLVQSIGVSCPEHKYVQDTISSDFDEINCTAGIKKLWLAHFHEKIGPMVSKYSVNKERVDDIVVQNALAGKKNSILAGVYDGRVMASYSFNVSDGSFRGKERMYALIVEKDSPVINFFELESVLRTMSCEYSAVISENLDKMREV